MFHSSCHASSPASEESSGFTILEVLVAVSIAAGVISVLAPALLRQVTLGEQPNRLTAVEAVVSRDLNWFSNYARVWKLKVGSYFVIKQITNASSYTPGAAATYEPPPATPTTNPCSSGLATYMIDDASNLPLRLTTIQRFNYSTYLPPYNLSLNKIPVSGGKVSGVNVIRTITPAGNKLRISYSLDGPNADGLTFVREASVLVAAAAWCDRLP